MADSSNWAVRPITQPAPPRYNVLPSGAELSEAAGQLQTIADAVEAGGMTPEVVKLIGAILYWPNNRPRLSAWYTAAHVAGETELKHYLRAGCGTLGAMMGRRTEPGAAERLPEQVRKLRAVAAWIKNRGKPATIGEADTGTIDAPTDYRSAKVVRKLFNFEDQKSLQRFLECHPGIKTRRPHTKTGREIANRLEIHLGDIADAKAREATETDVLDADPEVIERALAGVSKRKAEVDAMRETRRK